MTHLPNSPTCGSNGRLHARAKSLFTFLKELVQLRTRPVRHIDQFADVLWFSSIPDEALIYSVHLDREDRKDSEVWLEVRKPTIATPPQPSARLQPWIVREHLADSSRDFPSLLEELTTEEEDTHIEEAAFGTPNRISIDEHPEIRDEWEKFIEEKWWPWAEEDRRLQSVQRIYTKLFSIYQRQVRLGEQYEVVFSLGFLTWRTPGNYEIDRHLLAAQTSISFDSARGIISLGPAGEGARLSLEQDMLDPTQCPEPAQLRKLSTDLGNITDHVWDTERLGGILRGWVHSVSSRGTYNESIQHQSNVGSDPRVHLAPAIVLRKRTERSFVEAFKTILAQIEEGKPLPPGVERFLTEDELVSGELTGESDFSPETNGEVYFPLESNSEQTRIVERLNTQQGVLVQGPPGTGKSHTIVNLICHLLATGKRVLVTSHATRALKVLRTFITERVPEVSPLVVFLLGDDHESLQAMEDSVQGITQQHHSWNEELNALKIEELSAQLDSARREDAEITRELCSLRERETYVHPKRFGDYEGTLQHIAGRLRSEAVSLDWFHDEPEAEIPPPNMEIELRELLTLLRDNSLNNAIQQDQQVIDPALVVPAEKIAELIRQERAVDSLHVDCAQARSHQDYQVLSKLPAAVRHEIVDKLSNLVREADRLRRHIQKWTEGAVQEVLAEQDRPWRDLLQQTTALTEKMSEHMSKIRKASVSGLPSIELSVVRSQAEALLKHLESGGRWGFGPFRAKAVRDCLYFRDSVRVNGRSCMFPDELRHLLRWITLTQSASALAVIWEPKTEIPSSEFSTLVAFYEDLCEPLEAIVRLHSQLNGCQSSLREHKGLSEPTWHEVDDLKHYVATIQAVATEQAVREVASKLDDAADKIASLNQVGTLVEELVAAINERDLDQYEKMSLQIRKDFSISQQLLRREDLLAFYREFLPETIKALEGTQSRPEWPERISQMAKAWNWSVAKQWVEGLSDPDHERQLSVRLDRARETTRTRMQSLAAGLAWKHCFKRMTERERQHLVAWSKAMRSVGKGTGKYAAMHRREARLHMNECRSAIPAWIMPTYRVAETITPGNELFDVVIVDEASQSGPEALLLTYLAKKLIVVGDDKQIAPENVGINQEEVSQLRSRHLQDIPHGDRFGVSDSLFDLADIKFPGRIRLREHFRCMPEIINFCNDLFYRAEPLIPLRQYGSDRLSPVIMLRHTPDGYESGSASRKINLPEAQAIVNAIIECCSNPQYDGKSMGVISLLGFSQAREIEHLLLNKLGPEELERRQLVCGDAYSFQGDERDVMFLSMVAAPMEGRRIGTLVAAPHQRRFNVAVSRARDQLWLFHSVTLSDLSPQCLRYSLLQYCNNPRSGTIAYDGHPLEDLRAQMKAVDRSGVRPPEPFDSWFEVEVYVRIAERGFRVIPQYELAGYRIDLVVVGSKSLFAIECDGDWWHGPEQFANDIARERDLVRCGMRFERIRESAFRLDPEKALHPLWEKLSRVCIGPDSLAEQPQADELPSIELNSESGEPESSGYPIRKG